MTLETQALSITWTLGDSKIDSLEVYLVAYKALTPGVTGLSHALVSYDINWVRNTSLQTHSMSLNNISHQVMCVTKPLEPSPHVSGRLRIQTSLAPDDATLSTSPTVDKALPHPRVTSSPCTPMSTHFISSPLWGSHHTLLYPPLQ